MSFRSLSLIALSALCTVVANLLLRAGLLRNGKMPSEPSGLLGFWLSLGLQPLFLIGLFFYAGSALVWFVVISKENLSSSYPLLVGLTFALVTLGAMFFFHERMTWMKVAGILVILSGIVVVSRS